LKYKNYIISIPYNSEKIYFYKINDKSNDKNDESLEKDFYIKFNPDDKHFKFWKLYYAKNKQIFLIGYNYNIFESDKLDELGIYLLNIEEKKITQKAYFNYSLFVENKKIDRLYIYNKKSIIIYDFMTNTSKEKNININILHSSGKRLFFIGDYLVLTFVNQVSDWMWCFTNTFIMDKDCEIIKNKHIYIPFYFDMDNIVFVENSFQLISNNIFFINDMTYQDYTSINFAEINLNDNDNLLNKNDEELKNIFIQHEIKIKDENKIYDESNISLHPLNNEKLVINLNDNNFYILDIKNMQIITKIKINLQLNKLVKPKDNFSSFIDNILFLKMNEKIDCIDIYYNSNYNEILHITNK
jgi:hypothetical protein